MSREEFQEYIKAKQQYVILDDLVIDIKDFVNMHPGGQFVLK